MKFRPNIKKLTKQWDKGQLKDCYCLLFSNVWGFKIVWINEDGCTQCIEDGSTLMESYFVVLAVYETQEQAENHLKDFIKWSGIF